jgi:hypothetical protein
MFPWVDGFHWTVMHVVFLTIFGLVLLTVLATFLWSLFRTVSDFRAQRATEFCWRSNFSQLPEAERHCRHELSGRIIHRLCPNAFDCRHCELYEAFAAMPAPALRCNSGVDYSDKLLYHRGHTWVAPEEDGTFIVGLDELAHHLIGQPDKLEFPAKGSEIQTNGAAWRMTKNGQEIRVPAPIDGTILATGGPQLGWYLRVKPREPVDLRHLLQGPEVAAWLASEMDRLQIQLRAPDSPPALADGGTLMPELMKAQPDANWDEVLAATFLDA